MISEANFFKYEQIKMKKTTLLSLVLFFIGGMPLPASAEEFDGSKDLMCACMRVRAFLFGPIKHFLFDTPHVQ